MTNPYSSNVLPKPSSITVNHSEIFVKFADPKKEPLIICFYANQSGKIKVNCNKQVAFEYALSREAQAALNKYARKTRKKYFRKAVSLVPWEIAKEAYGDYLFHYSKGGSNA